MSDPLLVAEGAGYRAGGRWLVEDVSLAVSAGEMLALVGPNGAGKSTLLGLLAGDLRPAAGGVTLDGRPLRDWPARALAGRRAVLPQQTVLRFPFTVERVVSMGRAPHRRPFAPGTPSDRSATARAMRRADVLDLAERSYPTLSGGEQARASLARVLAQEAPLLLLDEPTAALDLRHQQLVMSTARSLCASGCAVVMVLHDLNLAAVHADRVAVMADGRLAACAPPWRALTREVVAAAFGHPVVVVRHPLRDAPLLVAAGPGSGAGHGYRAREA